MTGVPLPGSVPSPPVVDAPAARPVEKRTDRGTFEKHLDTPARNAPGHGVSDAHAAPSLQPANAGAQAPIDRVAAAALLPMPSTSVESTLGAGATIYPQGLRVIGYLSMLGVQTTHDLSAVSPSSADNAAAIEQRASMPGQGYELVGGETAGCSLHYAVVSAPIDADRSTMPGDEGTTVDATAAVDTSPAGRWLRRRLSAAIGESGTTLRLRDYHLAEGDIPAVVDTLLSHARHGGYEVSRIVVNGREVWAATGGPLMTAGKETT